jgi:inorganic phosphate transporter, PiT family
VEDLERSVRMSRFLTGKRIDPIRIGCGMRVTDLDPVQGFAAEVSGASVIQLASQVGIPISTTHAITSSILGVGASRRLSAVRWGVTLQILLSWVLTVPVAVGLGALYMVVLQAILPG